MKSFERKCAKQCEPGCQNYYQHEYCYHCCQQNLCNNVADTGAALLSGAGGVRVTTGAVIVTLAFWTLHAISSKIV